MEACSQAAGAEASLGRPMATPATPPIVASMPRPSEAIWASRLIDEAVSSKKKLPSERSTPNTPTSEPPKSKVSSPLVLMSRGTPPRSRAGIGTTLLKSASTVSVKVKRPEGSRSRSIASGLPSGIERRPMSRLKPERPPKSRPGKLASRLPVSMPPSQATSKLGSETSGKLNCGRKSSLPKARVTSCSPPPPPFHSPQRSGKTSDASVNQARTRPRKSRSRSGLPGDQPSQSTSRSSRLQESRCSRSKKSKPARSGRASSSSVRKLSPRSPRLLVGQARLPLE